MDIDELTAGRELDVFIAEKVMGLQVLGKCYAPFYECDPLIHPYAVENDPDNEPVYLKECRCKDIEEADKEAGIESERKVFGHDVMCLEVVPEYSTDIAAAWKVVECMKTHSVEVSYIPDLTSQWRAMIKTKVTVSFAETASLAICRAALKAVLG